jgi:hypothetical protein
VRCAQALASRIDNDDCVATPRIAAIDHVAREDPGMARLDAGYGFAVDAHGGHDGHDLIVRDACDVNRCNRAARESAASRSYTQNGRMVAHPAA